MSTFALQDHRVLRRNSLNKLKSSLLKTRVFCQLLAFLNSPFLKGTLPWLLKPRLPSSITSWAIVSLFVTSTSSRALRQVSHPQPASFFFPKALQKSPGLVVSYCVVLSGGARLAENYENQRPESENFFLKKASSSSFF